MKRGVASLVLAVCCTPLVAGLARADAPRYLFIDGDSPAALQRRLQTAGSAGYRLIATAVGTDVSGRSRLAALLERDAAGREYEYAVRNGTGDLGDASMREALDPLFEQGYHFGPAGFVVRRRPEVWLPESAYADQATIVLEREVGTGDGWDYAALSLGNEAAFDPALQAKRREGFEILGLWNVDRKLQVVLQRSRQAAAPESPAPESRLVLVATRKVLKVKINSMAREGYRIREAEDPPTAGPPILLLERTAEPGRTLEYRFVDKLAGRMREERLADKLNAYAARGWRLTRGGWTDAVSTLERDPQRRKRDPLPNYRLISSPDAEALAATLEAAQVEGYRYVTMVVEPARTSLLLEKPGAE